ncbi:MAG: substrate-binding domain-containing protein [Actinomycetota bacterium]
MNKLMAIFLAAVVSVTLTACDPPMPESLRIAQAELQVQCETGDVSVSLPESIADLGFTWSDSVTYGCEDMTITAVDEFSEDANLVIGEESLIAARCEPFLTVPIAIDAAVLVVNIPDVYDIYLSADQVISIFDGTITNWSDPALVENNEELLLPDLQIVLPTSATVSSKQALSDWIARLAGKPLDLSNVADAEGVTEVELATPLEEGAISIASFSASEYMGSVRIGIVTEPGNYESIVIADNSTIYAAKTQLISEVEGNGMKVSIDPSIEPTPEEGAFEAAKPYQAVYPVMLDLCGEDNPLIRTAARFLLRQDSQGVIASVTMLPLPEDLRIQFIGLVVVGLPTPTPVEQK